MAEEKPIVGGILGELIQQASPKARQNRHQQVADKVSDPAQVLNSLLEGKGDVARLAGSASPQPLPGGSVLPTSSEIAVMSPEERAAIHKQMREAGTGGAPLLNQNILRDESGKPLADSVDRPWTGHWFEDAEGNAFDEAGRNLDWAQKMAARIRGLVGD